MDKSLVLEVKEEIMSDTDSASKEVSDSQSDLVIHACHLCSFWTYSKANLKKHLVDNVHEGNPDSVDFKQERTSSEQWKKTLKIYHCDKCNYQSKNRANLVKHLIVHTDKSERVRVKDKLCKICGRGFSTRHGLSQHTKSKHEKTFRFICTICDKGFNSSSNYTEHLTTHDANLKQKCPLCPSSYRSKHSLLKHIKNVHDQMVDVLKCKHEGCSRTFASRGGLTEHLKVVHSDRLFHCSNCGKTFKWNSSFHFHKKICS